VCRWDEGTAAVDLGLYEEQEMLKSCDGDFREKEVPEKYVRDMEEDEKGYSPEVWSKMAEQGWQGLIIPEDNGGTGLGFLDLIVLLEEFGRALVPGPFIATTLAAIALLEGGSNEQKQQYLPRIASGEAIATLAITEPSARWDAEGIQLQATKGANGYTLNGTKLFIPDAHVADLMVVAARTGGSGESGVSLFIVDAKSPGISTEVLKTIASDKQCEVKFENVQVPAANLLGAEGEGFKIAMKVLDKSRPGIAAQALGIAQGALDYAVNYLKERVAFGKPLSQQQGLQFMLADMKTETEAARLLLYEAARKCDEGAPDITTWAAMCKLKCGDVAMSVTTDAVQLLGGYGYSTEYPVERMMRDAKITQIYEGTQQIQRIVIARSMVGKRLPTG